MPTETIIGLGQFCLLCFGLAVIMPCVCIVFGAYMHWAQTKRKDSFIDSLKIAHQEFWDSFADTF